MIAGVPEFTKLSLAFAYGKDSAALKENRVAGVQVSPEVPSFVVQCDAHTGPVTASNLSSGTADR